MKTLLYLIPLTTLITAVGASQKFNVFSDIFQTPEYSIKYQDEKINLDAARRLADSSPNKSYEIVRSSKQLYLCQIPEVAPYNEVEDVEFIFGLEKLSQLSHFIAESLRNITLFYMSGYFTYAFTDNRKVAQFYGTPTAYLTNKLATVHILGETNSKSVPNLNLNKDGEVWSLNRVIENGTICDLTGKPRRVEVQYICDPAQTSVSFQQVHEQKTCDYTIQVNIPELCNEEFFRVHQGEVICQEINDPQNEEIEELEAKPTNIHPNDYILRKINKDLFIGKPLKEQDFMSVLLDLDPKSGIMDKLGKSFFKVLKTKIASSSTQGIYLMGSKSFKYSSYVYDKFGNYLTTVMVEYESTANSGSIVINEYSGKYDLEENFSDIIPKKSDQADFEVNFDTQQQLEEEKENFKGAVEALMESVKGKGVEVNVDESVHFGTEEERDEAIEADDENYEYRSLVQDADRDGTLKRDQGARDERDATATVSGINRDEL